MIESKPEPQMDKYVESVECLLAGKWDLTKFKELPLIGKWAKTIGSVPIAIQVCLEHECAVRLKDVLWQLSPLSPDLVKKGKIDVAQFGRQLMDLAEETAFTAIASGIGLQLNEFASLIGSIALYLSINSTIIATQI